MRSGRPRLYLVQPRRTRKERWFCFLLLLAIPMIAGAGIAIWQSEIVAGMVEWPAARIDLLLLQVTDHWQRFRQT